MASWLWTKEKDKVQALSLSNRIVLISFVDSHRWSVRSSWCSIWASWRTTTFQPDLCGDSLTAGGSFCGEFRSVVAAVVAGRGIGYLALRLAR
jgi:hypothetical protein